MRTMEEVEVGGRYTCYVLGTERVCRVKSVTTMPGTSCCRIRTELEGGGLAVFRSPKRLVARLGEPVHNIKWGGESTAQGSCPGSSAYDTLMEMLQSRPPLGKGHSMSSFTRAEVAAILRGMGALLAQMPRDKRAARRESFDRMFR